MKKEFCNTVKKNVYLIIGTLALISDAVNGFHIINGILDNLYFIRNPPRIFNIIASILVFVGLISLIYYVELGIQVPRLLRFYIYISFIIGLILMPQIFIEKQSRKFVLVYDEVEPKIALPTDSIITIHIDEVAKIHQINQFENATIISIVSRPEVQWKNQFPKGNAFDSPIFSVHEVLTSISNNIVDISALSYRNEISNLIRDKKLEKGELRIFYEIGYGEIANNLKITLKKNFPDTKINLISYDKIDSKNLLDKNLTCIYLGTNKIFKENTELLNENKFKHLIIPNWLLSSIRSNEKTMKFNRSCVANTHLNDLTNNDFQVWANLISIIKSEEKNIQNENYAEIVKSKVLSYIVMGSNILIINF